jgi:hypothetical protein
MWSGRKPEFPMTLARFLSVLLVVGLLGGCGGRDNTGNSVAAAGPGADNAQIDAQLSHRIRNGFGHRYARHRHAAPR